MLETLNRPESASENQLDHLAILEELWDKGITYSKLARKGVEMEIDGSPCIVQHNKIRRNALLRIGEAEGDTMRLVLIENVYGGLNDFKKPKLSEKSHVSFDKNCTFNKESHTLTIECNTDSVEELKEILIIISNICDASNNIKKIDIKWNGDISNLLGFALTDRQIQKARVTADNTISVYNYKFKNGKPKENNGVQAEERATGNSIQKAICINESLLDDDGKEDIQLFFETPEIQEYIKKVMEESDNDSNHPYFQELLNMYFAAVLNVKAVRDSIEHIVPMQDKEIVTVIFQGDHDEHSAYFIEKSSDRSQQYYMDTENSDMHSASYLASASYTFEAGSNLVIDETSLIAELRHHIHYIATHGSEKQSFAKEHHFNCWKAVTEMIDDMQYFTNVCRNYDANPIRFGGTLINDGIYSENRWRLLSTLDMHNFTKIGLDGHDFIRYTLCKLGSLMVQKHERVMINANNRKQIDKIVFDFLLDLDIDTYAKRRDDWQKLVHYMPVRFRRMERLKELCAQSSVIEKEESMIEERLETLSDLFPDNDITPWEKYERLKEIVEMQNGLEEFFCDWLIRKNEVLSKQKEEKESDEPSGELSAIYEELAKLQRKLTRKMRDVNKLRKMLIEANPFIAPDGKKYPSIVSYALDPDVLLKEIEKDKTIKGKIRENDMLRAIFGDLYFI